ncbi:MAG: T9SS type A sorting domain-containing protein, partial [Bacteroidota bacterium]
RRNGVDMEIHHAQGYTRLLVSGVSDNGSVIVGVYYPINTTYALINNMVITPTSPINKTSLETELKGFKLIVAYNELAQNAQQPYNVPLKIHRIDFVSGNSGLTYVSSQTLPNSYLNRQTTIASNHHHQSVGLRTNGEIFFLRRSSPSTFSVELIQSAAASTSVTLGTGTSYANLVVTSKNAAFVANKIGGQFRIDLYDEHDVLAHTYTPSWEHWDTINHLAVLDCRLLATGYESEDKLRHEFFDCSDCQGGAPTAGMEFVNPHSIVYQGSPFGPQPVHRYCNINQVIVDASSTTCENKFHLSIWEFDLQNWTNLNTLYSGWVPGFSTAPHDLQISNYLSNPLTVGKIYMVGISVGNQGGNSWNYVNKFFQLRVCSEKPADDKYGKAAQAALEAETEEKWGTIFPNPNNGHFRLQLAELEPVKVSILDSKGQEVRSFGVVSQLETEFDLELSAGLYFVRLEKNGAQKHLKFIVR